MSENNVVQLDLSDIQGNILRSYSMPFARFFFLEIDSAVEERTALKEVVPLVTTAELWDEKPEYTFNLAFSYQGLVALGVKPESLALFSREFRGGMKSRASALGDTGESAPANWDAPLAGSNLHALIGLYSKTAEAREAQSAVIRDKIAQGKGAKIVYEQDCASLADGREHFGFEDGVSQPSVEGGASKTLPGQGTPMPDGTWDPLKPGEFIFGYTDEAGTSSDRNNSDDLRTNGGYLIVRKLEQKVSLFRQFVQQTAKDYFGGPAAAVKVGAKMIGRWPSGAALSTTPDKDDPALALDDLRNNDFRFKDDPVGLKCPLGAHIRRCNPRDALDGTDTVVRRHRMMRRGISYGPALPPGAPDDGERRGLLFLAVVADIGRQFEFVQQQWINRGDFAGLDGSEKDPLVGNNANNGQFLVPSNDLPTTIFDLPRFVVTKGGEYFFLPSISALKKIAGA